MAPPLGSLSPDARYRRHTCCPAIRPPPAKSAAAASLLGFAPFSSTFSPYLRCSLAPPRGPAANPNSARLRLPPHRQQPLLRLLSVDDYGLLLTDLKPQLEPRRGAAATASRVWPWPPAPWRGGRLHPIDLPRLLHGRHAPVVLPERRRARRPPPPEQRLPLLACISCAPPGQEVGGPVVPGDGGLEQVTRVLGGRKDCSGGPSRHQLHARYRWSTLQDAQQENYFQNVSIRLKVLLMTLQNAPPGLDYDRDTRFLKAFKEMVAVCLAKDQTKEPDG